MDKRTELLLNVLLGETKEFKIFLYSCLKAAMRRAGHNPTDVEVLDIINKIDDESGSLDFQVDSSKAVSNP